MHDFRHNEQYGLDPGFGVCDKHGATSRSLDNLRPDKYVLRTASCVTNISILLLRQVPKKRDVSPKKWDQWIKVVFPIRKWQCRHLMIYALDKNHPHKLIKQTIIVFI